MKSKQRTIPIIVVCYCATCTGVLLYCCTAVLLYQGVDPTRSDHGATGRNRGRFLVKWYQWCIRLADWAVAWRDV